MSFEIDPKELSLQDAAGREDEEVEQTLWPDDKQHGGLLEEDE